MNSPEIQRMVDALRKRSADLYDRAEKEAARQDIPELEFVIARATQEYIAREFRWLADLLEGKQPHLESLPPRAPDLQCHTEA